MLGDDGPVPSLYDSLLPAVSTAPERTALVLDDGRALTYGELDALGRRCAGGLAERGAGPGDRVVVQVTKSAEAVGLYLGCLHAGLVYVPLNTAYTDEEVAFFRRDAGASVFVDDDELRELVVGPPADIDTDRRIDEWAAMLYTSGTTGRSKGAMLSGANLLANARALHDAWRFEPDDVLLHVLPIFHVHGLFVALHCAFLAGATVRFHERFDTAAVRRDLRTSTVMMGVPTHYHRLLFDPEFGADDCRSMRLFTSGSAPLPAAEHDEFSTRTGHRIVERYGMTETMILTSNPYDGDRVAGTVGFPLPGVRLRVVRDDGSLADVGEVGMVHVRGDGVFLGYWKLPDRTAESFAEDGWFITGDLGSLDDTGRLTLVGRGSDLIISGGLNVYPKEIEAVLDAVIGVEESAVIGLPDPDLGEEIVAVLVGTATEADLRAACEPLARFKHPRRFAFVDALPRNAMGKVQKATLRATLSG